MSISRIMRLLALLVTLHVAQVTWPQAPFDLDLSFRTGLNVRYVSSIAELSNGDVLLSGVLRWPSDQFDRGYVRVTASGDRVLPFPDFAPGGGRITPWNSRYYIGNGPGVRRIFEDGTVDTGYILPSAGPYVFALQGGDYHVYPDGRVLMSGAHVLSDSIRGFEGLYSLIWFTNTGYLDTTRTHRLCNGVIYAIEEQPDGKFLCSGTMTTSWASLRYDLGKEPVAAQVRITDARGREVALFGATARQGQLLWDTRLVPAGVYTVELFQANERIAVERLIVQPAQ